MLRRAAPQRVRLSTRVASIRRRRTHTGNRAVATCCAIGPNARRADRPNLVLPDLRRPDRASIVAGRRADCPGRRTDDVPQPTGRARRRVARSGRTAREELAGCSRQTLRELHRAGPSCASTRSSKRRLSRSRYLKAGEYRQDRARRVSRSPGIDADGSLIVADVDRDGEVAMPDDRSGGSARTTRRSTDRACSRRFIPGRRFPFPKSLYAVEDALRFFVEGQAGRGRPRLLRRLGHDRARRRCG